MSNLKNELIRLAYDRPELRDEILPLVRAAADDEEVSESARMASKLLAKSMDKAMKHLADAMGYYNQIRKDPSVPAQDTADSILREWKMACSRLVKGNPFMTAAMFLKKASQYADRLEKW